MFQINFADLAEIFILFYVLLINFCIVTSFWKKRILFNKNCKLNRLNKHLLFFLNVPPIINIYFRSNVELKKVTGKYILKSTLTPKLARKEFKEHTSAVQNSISNPTELPSTSSSLPASLITQVCNLLQTWYIELDLHIHCPWGLGLEAIIIRSTVRNREVTYS